MLLRLILPALFLFPLTLRAENGIPGDTTHSPKKAAIYSAVLPGLGQAYNRKYWKIPIVYAGIGTSTYFIIDNNRNYHKHRNEYLFRIQNSGANSDPDLTLYSDDQLLTLIDQYRRWRDISWIAAGVFYALNIVDATVDGYLWRFDTSTDLSFHIRPSFFSTTGIAPGFRLGIKF